MLFRDNAAEIAAMNGAVLKTRTLSNEEFREVVIVELREKLASLEAATKKPQKDRKKALTKELANFFELIDGFMSNEGLAPDHVYQEQRRHRDDIELNALNLGGYRKRVALVEGEG